MFNNVALDVFIGLVFIFLLYSLLVTIIQEIIANLFSLRARMLYKGVRRMLEDGNGSSVFIEKFYGHPTIKYLAENSTFNKPAYLHRQTFSQTLIHILRGENYTNAKNQMEAIKAALDKNDLVISDETRRHLNNLYIDAQHDIDVFTAKLEKWYDDTMDRVSGWYKKQTQWILIVIGFVLAAVGNIDTIKIYNFLSKDKSAREQLVNMAIQSQQKYAAAINEIKKKGDSTVKKGDTVYSTRTVILSSGNDLLDSTFKDVSNDAAQASNILGLGWGTSVNYKALCLVKDSIKKLEKQVKTKQDSVQLVALKNRRVKLEGITLDRFTGSSIPGWLLLGLAVSLGAPFWFDLLQKFINIRNAGVKPPSTSKDETSPTTAFTLQREQIKVVQKKG
jgi:hypothetical protein